MKKGILLLLVLIVAIAAYWFFFREKKSTAVTDVKEAPLVVRKHSASFNASVDSLLSIYFNIKDAFVNADTTTAKAACTQLIQLSDTARFDELKKDAPGIYESAVMQIGDIKANAESLLQQKDLTEMRQDFRMIGENIYPFLKTINYDGKTLYWQNCPMAFGENKEANWISSTAEVINPYLGKNHPEYKATMLHCGEIKDSIKAK